MEKAVMKHKSRNKQRWKQNSEHRVSKKKKYNAQKEAQHFYILTNYTPNS